MVSVFTQFCDEGGRRNDRVNTLDLHFELRHPNAVGIANYPLANMQDLSLIQQFVVLARYPARTRASARSVVTFRYCAQIRMS
jgi:hypothetical protein